MVKKSCLALGLAAASLPGTFAVSASANPVVSCAGSVLAGAALMMCSHTDPTAPMQFCTFKWELTAADNQPQAVQGAFAIPPAASNVQIYQGAGFARAMSSPIVLCQGRKGKP